MPLHRITLWLANRYIDITYAFTWNTPHFCGVVGHSNKVVVVTFVLCKDLVAVKYWLP